MVSGPDAFRLKPPHGMHDGPHTTAQRPREAFLTRPADPIVCGRNAGESARQAAVEIGKAALADYSFDCFEPPRDKWPRAVALAPRCLIGLASAARLKRQHITHRRTP